MRTKFINENNLYKPTPENLRGTTRIQLLVVQISQINTLRLIRVIRVIRVIRDIRGQKLFHALQWIFEEQRR